MNTAGWTTVHLFWPENADRFHARDPFPVGGVVEDPATGAAAAAFGGYLRDLGRIDRPTRLTVIKVLTWAGQVNCASMSTRLIRR